MRFSSFVSAAVAGVMVGFGATPAWAAPSARAVAPGSLSLVEAQPLFTFSYSTDAPGSKNWIGIYNASGGGPDKEEFVTPSLVWAYAPQAQGTLNLASGSLKLGSYKVYFLANDGYKWLAEPIIVELPDPSGPSPTGSLSLVKAETLFTFEYTTGTPSSTNWVGLYRASGGGPDKEQYVSPSLVWKYAPGATGKLTLLPGTLQPGSYKAFFLANDGYKWLAQPITVELPAVSAPVSFIVDQFTTQNARQGDAFKANISGLLTSSDSQTTFAIVSSDGGDWAKVSASGVVSGTPGASAQQARLTIKATAADKSTDEIEVTIPVRPAGKPLVRQLSVMSYNLWYGGTRVNDYHVKQVRYLVGSGADVVGFQESTGDHATRLGKALGWYSWQGRDVGFISRYPIVKVGEDLGYTGSARIALDGDASQVNIWNVHLGYTPYGPYDFCFDHMSVDKVMEREAESGRTPQIITTLAAMKEDLANSHIAPVILLGDFNAPSHLDYTEALREKNCGYANISWPTSILPTDAGLIDTFRVANPDPVTVPGISWSPIYLQNGDRPEPLDRIDFIYQRGRMSVLESEALVVGNPTPEPNHQNNEWTSDHAAILTVFDVQGPCVPRP